MRALAVLVCAFVLAGAAFAAKVDLAASTLTIASGDIAGSTQTSQGPIHEKGYSNGYQRSFRFATPNGASGLVFFESEALVAQTIARAANDVAAVRAALQQPAGRAAFIASVAANLKVKPSMVKPGALRSVNVGDSSVVLPLMVQLPTKRLYESLLYMQRDRVVSVIVSAGTRPTAVADSRRLARAAVTHVNAALAPVLYVMPTIDGLAQVGEVLTATPGTWSDPLAKLTYQWRRCDATGATCTDITGAGSSTYTVADADAGSTLRVEVTATNRFGATKGDAGVTAVVVEPPLPPPPPPPAE
jgi:hypothetical protein